LKIRKIDTTSRRDVNRFVQFPFQLYRFCAQWVPPLVSSVKRDLDRERHPFFQHSTAEFFTAESGGQILGRIAVMHHRNYNAYHDSKLAFFGLFEVVEDVQVARALFDAACAWAKGQGLEQILGPKGLIGSDGGGVLVKGFAHRPAMGAAYNLPYYDDLITDSGFVKDRDFLSAHLDRSQQDLPERFYFAAERLSKRRGLIVKSFRSRRELRRWVPRAVEAHADAFGQNYTYYPPTVQETALVTDMLLAIADPRLIKIVLKGERIVGFILALPNLSVGLQKARGRLWPLGWYHLLQERRHTRHLDIPALGFLPAYQGLGGNALLYVELAKTILPSRFKHADLMQIDEHNVKSLREVENMLVTWHKTHRTYRRAL
jgi:hypothetical protein